jgi:2-methylaconitate cis-trans-isomerase PrpF
MTQTAIDAVFMRGGTSKGVFFHARDLPSDQSARDALFSVVLGSPDPYGRQLDGLGGGISSLSKAVIITPSARDGIDVDYTFAQVDVGSSLVDYGATCGNLSSAVGPFAVDEGLVQASGSEALIRVYNTNTDKVFEARFALLEGRAAVAGDFTIAGVAGGGAKIQLDFLDPGGARTGRLLPTGNVIDPIDVPGLGTLDATLVDATNPCVFVAASDLGLGGDEPPSDIDGDAVLTGRLEHIRAVAGHRMGLAESAAAITATSKSAPKVAVVSPPVAMQLLDGSQVAANEMDLAIRMVSMGICHKAVPLTGGMCAAVAARIDGGVVNKMLGPTVSEAGPVRLGTPSGILPVGAGVTVANGTWTAERVTVYRTARRLMQGQVLLPEN